MTVRRHHPHHLRLQLPQHTVQDRTALFVRDSERGVLNELLKIARANTPALVEAHAWKRRELVARETQNLEVRPTAIERYALLAGSSNSDGRWRKLARDLAQL